MVDTPNYPDILSYITGGQAATISVVQAALAAHPPVVAAGSTFESVLLLQNTTDVNVEVTAMLHLPPQDAARVKGRFGTQAERQVATLLPAEVGYLSLPSYVYPDAAPGTYKVGVDVRAVPLSQPRRIRQAGTNGEINLDYYFYLNDEAINQVVGLRELTFSTGKRGGLAEAGAMLGTRLLGRTSMLGSGLETAFTVEGAHVGKLPNFKPGWVSLWALGDGSDSRPLLERHRDTLANAILPQLNRETLFKPFYRATQERLKPIYPIHQLELVFIAKLLTSVVEAAVRPPQFQDYDEQEMYYVGGLLERGWPADGSPIPLPNWCRVLLSMIGLDENAVNQPSAVLAGPLYEEVLWDAITHGIAMLYAVTGQQLGTREDARIYTDYLVAQFRQNKQRLSFADVYLPLVIGGILVNNDVVMPGEEPLYSFQGMHEVLQKRAAERNDDNDMIFSMTEQSLAWALRRYREWV